MSNHKYIYMFSNVPKYISLKIALHIEKVNWKVTPVNC
jgi:hypothetical protein